MNDVLFPAMRDVGERIARAPHVLLGLDYDGTLTPIVENPAQTKLCSSMRGVLWSLAKHDDLSLVILGGRTAADLQECVGVSGATYVGNHGLEVHGPGFAFVEPAAQTQMEELQKIKADLNDQLRHINGVILEDKGLSLTVHHRRVAPVDQEEVWRAVFMVTSKVKDLFQLTTGNKVYEVRPVADSHKGTAMGLVGRQLGRRGTLMVYLGDDASDEDAFQSLTDAVTIKVGDSSATAAQYLLPGPAEVQCFLEWIDEMMREKVANADDSRRIVHVGSSS